MISFHENYPVSTLTTLGIGGQAKYFCDACTEKELIEVITYAEEKNVPYLVIGGGSNLLVSEKKITGIFIKNSTLGIVKTGSRITVKSGTALSDLVNFTIWKGLGGINNMAGIPGTVGGAVYGCAGAYGHNISDYLGGIICWDPKLSKKVVLTKKQCKFGYRDSIFKTNSLVILEIIFENLFRENPQKLFKQSVEILKRRLEKYPQNTKCPGSFFKNITADTLSQSLLKKIPEEKIVYGKIPAGFLLESVGAKGDRIGNIMVSENHGNTFINLGEGTAKDFYKLAEKYYRKVFKKFGIKLEPEVRFVNLPALQ